MVCGQKPEYLARLVAGTLCRFGAVRLRVNDSLLTVGDGLIRYAIDAVSRPERLDITRSVLLLADQSAPRRLELSEAAVVISGSDNRRMLRLMNGRSNPVVTCGTGVRDTVTLSSAAGEKAILCAQRQLPSVCGGWIEPLEFAAVLNGCTIRSALLAAAAAAVCGCDLSSGDVQIGLPKDMLKV